jgi:Domain of unknown function (DUF4126)
MNPALLSLPAAFGLAGASGLNASLPLLIVSLLARMGLVHLASPYDALQSDVAFYGLILLALVEFGMDKVPVLDSIGHVVMTPVAAASGAILFASQTGAVSSADPGLIVLASLLVGGSVSTAIHVTRSTARPFANLAVLGPPLSLLEDAAAAALSLAALLAPFAVPVVVVLIVAGVVLLVHRRRTARAARTFRLSPR